MSIPGQRLGASRRTTSASWRRKVVVLHQLPLVHAWPAGIDLDSEQVVGNDRQTINQP